MMQQRSNIPPLNLPPGGRPLSPEPPSPPKIETPDDESKSFFADLVVDIELNGFSGTYYSTPAGVFCNCDDCGGKVQHLLYDWGKHIGLSEKLYLSDYLWDTAKLIKDSNQTLRDRYSEAIAPSIKEVLSKFPKYQWAPPKPLPLETTIFWQLKMEKEALANQDVAASDDCCEEEESVAGRKRKFNDTANGKNDQH